MSVYVVTATWDDVPHLTDEQKQQLWDRIPPHQREARSRGVPALGSGAIYPVPESDITVCDFPIPNHWPRSYALDVGWNRTAAIWGAQDRESGILYLYSEHYVGQEEPAIHATAIKSRGDWIQGVIDPAAKGRSQHDGETLIRKYEENGLRLEAAKNAVEAGLFDVWQLLSGGRLKVFESLSNWRTEFRLYRRDINGKIVKKQDHLMDCTRYLVVSGRDVMRTQPAEVKPVVEYFDMGSVSTGWMS